MNLEQRTLAIFMALADAPCGDVNAARKCARVLLTDSQIAINDLSTARLLLSAALVHLQARASSEPTLADLRTLLLDLRRGAGGRDSFARSSSGLVRFAAAELAEGQFDEVLSQILRIFVAAAAVAGPQPLPRPRLQAAHEFHTSTRIHP